MKTRIHTYKTNILPTNFDWSQAGEGMSYIYGSGYMS